VKFPIFVGLRLSRLGTPKDLAAFHFATNVFRNLTDRDLAVLAISNILLWNIRNHLSVSWSERDLWYESTHL